MAEDDVDPQSVQETATGVVLRRRRPTASVRVRLRLELPPGLGRLRRVITVTPASPARAPVSIVRHLG